jgi:putative peptidoglycan lipid II flippase
MSATTAQPSSEKVARAAGAMGAATFLSRILGLVREQVLAYFFGAGMAMDAFTVAFRIPNLLRDLFAEGAMSSALVPTFVGVREKEGLARAWQVAGRLFRALFGVVSLLAILGIFFAEPLTALYAGAFRAEPGKFELTVRMVEVLFPFFPLVALAAAYMAILNAQGAYFFPAFASAIFNAVSITTGVALSFVVPHFGLHPIEGIAIGVVIGGASQAFSQLPVLYRRGYVFSNPPHSPSFFNDPALRRILILMVPGTLALAATQINFLVNTIFASQEGTGAVSWLNYAMRLMQFPIGIFGVSLAAATLPVFSEQWSRSSYTDCAQTLRSSLRQMFAVNFPASAGLFFLGVPIVELLFEYGRFTSADTEATARALAGYSVGLAAYSTVKILVPACYAMGVARIAVASSVLSVVCNYLINRWLLENTTLGYVALAYGTSLTVVLNGIFVLIAANVALGRKGVRLGLGGVALDALRIAAPACFMGVCVAKGYQALAGFFPEDLNGFSKVLARLIQVGISLVFSGILVVLLSKVFRIQEINAVARRIRRRK